MSSKLAKKALNEVIPTYEGELPSKLVEYVERLYNLSSSKMILKQQEEVARHHLCAIVSVENLQEKFDLPETVMDKVPIAPVTTKKLLKEMRMVLSNKSPSKSVPGTPQKSQDDDISTPRSRRRISLSPAVMTPSTSARKRLFNEPKTPGSESPSPSKRSRGRPPGALNRTTLEKLGQSPFKTESTIKTITPFLSPNKKVHLSTAEVIRFCNNFELPREVTANVLHTFSEYHNRIKHEWALLCGLIALVYNIINHDILDNKPKNRQAFFEKLHGLQGGALLKQSLVEWISLINEFFKDTKWIKQLKFEYGLYSNTNIDIPSMGNMLTVNRILLSEDEYEDWKTVSCEKAQIAKTRKRKIK